MPQKPPTAEISIGDEDGAAMLEYGLMISLIALACYGIIKTFGGDLLPLFVVDYFN